MKRLANSDDLIFEGVTYLVLSMSGNFEVSDFSQMTGILSGYLSLILSASLFLCSIEIDDKL